jgi:hypothetical protein
MRELRREIALLQVTVLLHYLPKDCVLRIAVRSGEGETGENADAFIRAVYHAAGESRENLWDRVIFDESGDVSEMATRSSPTPAEGLTVLVVNGASPRRLGNHWENMTTAKVAIEENLHRRSVDLAAFAYVVNYSKHRSGDLQERLAGLGMPVWTTFSLRLRTSRRIPGLRIREERRRCSKAGRSPP